MLFNRIGCYVTALKLKIQKEKVLILKVHMKHEFLNFKKLAIICSEEHATASHHSLPSVINIDFIFSFCCM